MISFDDFINPNGDLLMFNHKYLDLDSLEYCSYVIYFVLEHCNGEIMGNYFVIDDKDKIVDFYYNSYVIYAINYLDNIVCEVIKSSLKI